ncbi:hypothetical protein M885DRAFT_520441 [Pelagophyceae sp. CCMP2097]|nr:hypothetical protein M885DRAFT_520441 [Pelagophyceae sp. CCMP2097]|mmetsp:Transcript_23685/g.79926  ORF Transcript_23685/g.79926 Transcript_23685/m.79926 type:complete len:715 (-) Transcript_23685:24-2168(-)
MFRVSRRACAGAGGGRAVVCTPSRLRVEGSRLSAFARVVSARHGFEPFCDHGPAEYARLHAWSVQKPDAFWRDVFRFCGLVGDLGPDCGGGGPRAWRASGAPGDVGWFPGAKVNHAEILLQGPSKPDDAVALLACAEASALRTTTYGSLRARVARLAAALAADGVGRGDRVAGVVANNEGAVAAMLAATALGATWSSVSPDFGEVGCLDRLRQVAPKVLFVTDRYVYRGNEYDVFGKLASFNAGDVAAALPSVERCVALSYDDGPLPAPSAKLPAAWRVEGEANYAAPFHEKTQPEYSRGPFEAEVYVMFSSGTTGAPKCIVQGPGVALNQAKEAALHMDLRAGDVAFWHTTTGWMMWNWVVGASLTTGGTALLYDGDAAYGNLQRLWDVAAEAKVSLFGGSARYFGACAAADFAPPAALNGLRTVGSTGSPASPETFRWLGRHRPGVPLVSMSGGTDLNGSFFTGCPWLEVREEVLQCRGLGLDADVFSDDGMSRAEPGLRGELGCGAAFPCAPLRFLGDDSEGTKYRASYFDFNFGASRIWKHGDFCERDDSDGFVILGRSDATLNPGGVRIGTAEIYRALDQLRRSQNFGEAVVVGMPYTHDDGSPDVRVVLFLQTGATGDVAAALALPEALVAALKQGIRRLCSPRHVPALICGCPEIPTTTNGKIVEMAVARALARRPISNRGALANPNALDFFEAALPHLEALAGGRR